MQAYAQSRRQPWIVRCCPRISCPYFAAPSVFCDLPAVIANITYLASTVPDVKSAFMQCVIALFRRFLFFASVTGIHLPSADAFWTEYATVRLVLSVKMSISKPSISPVGATTRHRYSDWQPRIRLRSIFRRVRYRIAFKIKTVDKTEKKWYHNYGFSNVPLSGCYNY